MKNLKENGLYPIQKLDLKQNQNGITLIALIITIILLLILAGVTISLLTGENSILKYAKTATEQYKIEQGKERIELILAEVDMKDIVSKIKTEIDELVEIIVRKDGITGAEKIDDTTIKVKTEEGYEYEVTIDEKGKTKVEHIGKAEDKEGPKIIEISATNLLSSGYTITVNATDSETGIKEYKYYINNALRKITEEPTYTETELVEGPIYNYYVIVVDNKNNQTKSEVQEIKHTHIDQCYSTACTGTFIKTATTQETWKTCTHTHTGDSTNGGGCFVATSRVSCGQTLTIVNNDPNWTTGSSNCQYCYRPITDGYVDANLVCGRCNYTYISGETIFKCYNCKYFTVGNYYAGTSYARSLTCSRTITTYSQNCGKTAGTTDWTRDVETWECDTCGASTTHNPEVESFACTICNENHSAEEEGATSTTHNIAEEYKVCNY